MGESSIFWTTGTTGDGEYPYTESQLFSWLRRTFGGDWTSLGGKLIYRDKLNVLVTGPGSVAVGTGAAYVYGIPYENDSTITIAIPRPNYNTRKDRIVLRADWSTKTVRVARLEGVEGSGNPPPLTQEPGTVYEIHLATVTAFPDGSIGVANDGEYCRITAKVGSENYLPGSIGSSHIAAGGVRSDNILLGAVLTEHIANGAVTTGKIADSAVTAAKIAGGPGSGVHADLLDGQHLADLDNRYIRGQGAVVGRETSLAIPNNTGTYVSFETEIFDSGGYFDPNVPDRLTCSASGVYLLWAQVEWDSAPAGTAKLGIRRNGPPEIALNIDYLRSDELLGQQVVCIRPLETNDYIQAIVYQNSGQSVDIGPADGMRVNLGMIRLY